MVTSDQTKTGAGRDERLGAALRENLKRRKARARSRAPAGKPEAQPDPDRGSEADRKAD